MRFADPTFLAVAAVAAMVLVALFVALAGARRRALAKLGSFRLLPELTASLSSRRRLFKQIALVAGASLLCVALARPQLGYSWEEAHRRGVDLLFAIDTSKSMLTRDVKPDRLERAKLAVRSLVQQFPADRVGLVAFAGNAFVETPLTLDHGIFDESVAALDTDVIPLGGTDIASAIEQADKALAHDDHRKVLVLITDGEDLSGRALSAAERAAKRGVVIYTLGVGTPGGELIPVPGPDGQTRFVRDESGALVTSRLDEALLGKIARVSGGDYRPLGDSGQGLESLYRDELSKLPKSDLASRSIRVPIERFQWPLAAGLLLLGMEPLVGERRRRRRDDARASHRRASAAAVGIAALLVTTMASASPQSAESAYRKGDFTAAQQQYAAAARSAPNDPRLQFNLGAAAYREGDFDAAAKAFENTLRTDDLGLQEQAYYNLGNASFRRGEAALGKNDVDAAIGHWKRSISEYEGSLRLRANDSDARFNLELVKRRLADLEKKREEQKQQQQKQNGNDSKDQKQNGNGSKDQKQNGNDSKDQKQDGNGSKDQKQSGNGSKDQKQDGNGSKDQKQDGNDSKDQKQNGNDSKDQKQNGNDSKDQTPNGGRPQPGQQGAGQQRDEQAGPGELSKADAESLLDSLRGELRLTTRAPVDAKHPTQQSEPRRDW